MMTDTPVSTRQMTIDEFVRLYDTEGPFELINGERIPLSPTVAGHNYIVKILLAALIQYEQQNPVGESFFETPFILPDSFSSTWVTGSRVPDIMFIQAEQLQQYKSANPDWKSKPIMLIPDLVVEVISQNDQFSEVEKKVARYQEDGVKLIWVVDPQTERVTVFTQDTTQQTKFTGDMVLTGGVVLPGFEIKVSEIFN